MKEDFKFYWLNPKAEPRKTNHCGDGLFAREKIRKGERILIVGGYILTVDEESKLAESPDNGIQITKDFVICTTKKEEYGGFNFLNHSCEPNAGFNGQIFLVAMKGINRDEEITIDYAMVLHKANKGPAYKLECLCGAETCRKQVSENDWKNKNLQEKYRGYFQSYLQDEIDRLER